MKFVCSVLTLLINIFTIGSCFRLTSLVGKYDSLQVLSNLSPRQKYSGF